MKKIVLNLIMLASFSMAFSLDSITSTVTEGIGSAVTGTTSMFNDEKASTTESDIECKNPIENYNFNYLEALRIIAIHSASNSSKIMGFFSGKDVDEEETSKVVKKLASELAKKTVWIPAESEKIYGQYIFEKRKENGDVIDRTTKNSKYKKMYKKIDLFTKKYKSYLRKNKFLEDTEYPFNIKIFITSNSNQVEAIPGGYIFISEDYIKGNRYGTVLAHELTHISKRHTTKELQFRLIRGYDSIGQIADFIRSVQSTENTTLAKINLSLAGKDLILKMFSKHSQDQELEADSCSLKILTSINRKNKKKYIKELVRNIDLTIQKDNDTEDRFLTIQEHPNKEKRIKHIKDFSKTL